MTMLNPVQARFARLIRAAGVFDDAFYLAGNPDVAAAGTDPLEHYIVAGEAEGRFPCRFFDPAWYLVQRPRPAPGACLLVHYLVSGDADGLQPFVGIDPAFVRGQTPAAQPALMAIMAAAARGTWCNPNRCFDHSHYRAANPDVAAAGVDAYWHFVTIGADEGRLPSAGFSWFEVRERFHLTGSNGNVFRKLMLGWRSLAREAESGSPSVLALQHEVRANHRPAPVHQPRARPPLAGTRRPCEVYAFYLPQFHRVAENDRWWGEGFTEWHNVVRGVPRFSGHYQPRVPSALGFYDLDDPRVMPAQIDLAKQAGVSGFAFYYYNFGNERLLERPLERFLADPALDIGYFLIWANETWSRRWDGSETEVLIEQTYPDTLVDTLADDLVRHFADPRYKRIEGRPLFVIYRAGALPDAAAWIVALRKAFAARGVDPLLYMAQTFDDLAPGPFGLDGAMEFPPHKVSRTLRTITPERLFTDNAALRVWDYNDFVAAAAAEPAADFPLIRTCFPSWDNDGRRQGASSIVHGATPAAFGTWLNRLVDAAEAQHHQPNLVCINAWNEWGEGAYLEPDRYFGHAFLNTVQRVLHPEQASAFGRVVLVGHDACLAGAQRLLLQIGRTLAAQWSVDIVFVLMRADPGYDGLLADYRAAGETIVVEAGGDLAAVAHGLAERGFGHAIVNSSASAAMLAPLVTAGLAPVLLVHELTGVLDSLRTAPLIAAAAPQLRAIVAPTPAIATMLGDRGVAGAITVLPQGQYRLLAPMARMRAAGVMPVIVGIGRADRRKGIDLFVAACAAMAGAARFVWQGDWDPETRAALAGDVDRLVAAGWLTLRPDDGEIAATLAASDVFFLSSREDPLPSAAIEAWSSGLPVVAFAGTGGIAHLIADEPALGILAPLGEPLHAVRALREALDPPADRARLGRRRAALAADRFDWSRYCRRLLDLVQAAPQVDVAIIGHDHGRFAEARIASLLHQSLPPAQITYYDVASTDGSAEVAQTVAAASGGRVGFTALPANLGRLDRTWASLADASSAPYIHIAEGDDSIGRTMLDRCVAALEATPAAAFAFCGVAWTDVDDRIIALHGDYPGTVIGADLSGGNLIPADLLLASDLLVRNPILSMSSVVWRRDVLAAVLREHPAAFDGVSFAYDWLLYILMARSGRGAVFVPEILCHHRQHSGSFAARDERVRHAAEIARLYKLVPSRDRLQEDVRGAYLESLGA